MDNDLLYSYGHSLPMVVRNDERTSCRTPKHVAHNVKFFPDDKRFNSTKLERLQCVVNSRAASAGVSTDVVQEFLEEQLLLHEPDVR